ncbi:hypothetical protein LCGC14_2913090, partial [marine sediment metagenome]
MVSSISYAHAISGNLYKALEIYKQIIKTGEAVAGKPLMIPARLSVAKALSEVDKTSLAFKIIEKYPDD